MTSALTVRHLSHSFQKDHPVLSDISFTLNQGEITLLCGTNGAGKSVLLKLLKGLYKVKSGSILIDGNDLTKKDNERLRQIGLVFQNPATQQVGTTVEADIRFGMDNLGLDKETQTKRLTEAATLLHLDKKLGMAPRTLSGGEQERLAIAGVLVMRPKLVMMDEPFSGLDWPNVSKVLSSLLALKRQGTTILLVTHDVQQVLSHADHILLMDKGTLIADGKPDTQMLGTLRNHGVYVPSGEIKDMTWLREEDTP